MTIKEKAKVIALNYVKFHCCERREYYTDVLDYYIVIDMSFDAAHHFTVALYDGLYSDDAEIECFTETKETIIDAVEIFLKEVK